MQTSKKKNEFFMDFNSFFFEKAGYVLFYNFFFVPLVLSSTTNSRIQISPPYACKLL